MKKKDIQFLRVTYLRGPNIWTYRPVLEAWVDIGELEESPSNTIPGFYERLSSWLPTLIEHRCGVGVRGGFLQRVQEGTWPAHIMEHVVLELQNLAGMQVGFGKARSTSEYGVYKVAVRARNEQVSRAAMEAGRDLVMAAIEDRPFDVKGTVERLKAMVDDYHLGPSTACIVDAATERRIPHIRLTDGNLVQLGQGALQRRIWTAETDRTSAIAESIASDKDLTKRLLQSCGVPVPEGQIVASPEAAWEAAQDIGLPVVVKPTDANHGRGVSLDLSCEADVQAAFKLADRHGSDVIVERFVRGDEHRLLVVGNRVVAVAKGEAAWVTGDGSATVAQLIDTQLNTDPRRGLTEDFPLNRIMVDQDAVILRDLERQGLKADSVPAEGRRVLIQRNGNVANDVTDNLHPDVEAMATLAARVVGLDIAGVDVVAEDIGQPLHKQGGAIVEVNAGPGLLMHLKPAQGAPRPVGRAIVDHLFPEGDSGRIPTVGISGSKGTTLIARLVAHLQHLAGRHVGLACRDGLFLDRRQVESRDCTHWEAGQRLLINRVVEAAVFEHTPVGILTEGLPYDRCQVGIVTDVTEDGSLTGFYIHEPEQVYNVLRTQIDVVMSEGASVLNANDALVAEMADLSDGEVIFYAEDPTLLPIVEHLANGGRAVFLRDQTVMLASGSTEQALATLDLFPLTRDGATTHIESVLAAVAAAWALGISPDLICAGIENFEAGTADAAVRARITAK
ncbi:cyanophycin synthetase [Chitinivorax tropicus]|uniref:Cyanophycin synthetase n=1 Tax=Chitinivorax tropicus TaxID=714531 RepID=A0A840MPA8_9PROT|nr:cyanophycin synthetase [Chitinivorax tropicus]MBB5019295.1 cyanophycin synthetase [Chitinivorax tropicus]